MANSEIENIKVDLNSKNINFNALINNLDRLQFFYHTILVEVKEDNSLKKEEQEKRAEFLQKEALADTNKMIKIAKGFASGHLKMDKAEDLDLLDFLKSVYTFNMDICRNKKINEKVYNGWLKEKENI